MHYRLTLTSAVLLTALTTTTLGHAGEPLHLLETVAKWQYPGSKINGAMMQDAARSIAAACVSFRRCSANRADHEGPDREGDRVLQDQVNPEAIPDGERGERTRDRSRQSVMFHDDSQGRPLQIHIILVNTESRRRRWSSAAREAESETHIAWTHYVESERSPTKSLDLDVCSAASPRPENGSLFEIRPAV